ncbi:MAG: hypothetical protein IKQ95_08235 [Synergistaceae bacterium]|nr:hypothetical protein [Synergistaceae bacterium]
MTAPGLSVFAGIDAGSSCSKLAYSDNLGTRVLSRADGADFMTLREDAEIFFGEPVYSCVVAVHDDMPRRQRETLRSKAVSAGFRDVNIIGQYEALSLSLADSGRILACDFGASGCKFAVLEGEEVLESVNVDAGGEMFGRIFAEYLCERRLLKKVTPEIMSEAKRIMHILSENESRLWHNMNICRDDFARLIYFPVKRASHTFRRLLRVWKPERAILTGGCAKIPLVREFFPEAEIIDDVIVKGAALKGLSLSKQEARKNIADSVSRLRALRAEILRIEDGLTRSQKDRVYTLFRQAEGFFANDAGIITMMENLIREIRNA